MVSDRPEFSQVRSGVAFIVPTLKRPTFLRQCLTAIEKQTVAATRVLVGLRSDDAESPAAVVEFTHRLPVQTVEARGIGVIGSMSSCLAQATEEFVALVDDDVELPPHWLETMLRHLADHPRALAVAGRDLLQDHPEMRRTEPLVENVGRFHWFGRITGDHHRGGGMPRAVDILRGSNCLFRGAFLREVGFEKGLRGQGAQVNWELALAFQAMQREQHFFYDPSVGVIHHTAPRFDHDTLHRGGFDFQATVDSSFNETLVLTRYAPGFRKWTGLAYVGFIGSSFAPGILHFLRQLLRRDVHAFCRLRATVQGRCAALTRREQQSPPDTCTVVEPPRTSRNFPWKSPNPPSV